MDNDIPEGYKTLAGVNPAEDYAGPYYYKKIDGGLCLAFRAGAQHGNGIGTLHGGVLMMFADYTITMTALNGYKENCATISFNSEFIGPGKVGDLVEAKAEVIRRTNSMVFIRGEVFSGDNILLAFSGVARRLK